MLLRVLNMILVILAIFLAVRFGTDMITLNEEMVSVYRHVNFSDGAIKFTGIVLIASALLLLLRKTFVAGNILLILQALMLFVLNAVQGDGKGAVMALPFIILHIIILLLRYPFVNVLIKEHRHPNEPEPKR
ncbi:hypothetical protein [Gynurincola endophyticus]|uniref:hypothetical protein n=1 Tax=Gynurincola endophyticus TaxID=2479004 RepID=UPI000F8D8B61|nr:hypothetical protein [Gynurincola endophyticus]